MLILTKIQQAKYIDDMYDNEYLYFTSLKNLRNVDSDHTGRFDPKELNMSNIQLKTLTLKPENGKEILLHKFMGFNAQLMESISDPKINCCSLHRMQIEPGKPPSTFNENLWNLGDKAILIYDWVKFFKILDKSILKQGLQFSRNKVTYYDPKNFDGNISLHHKDHKYSWQNEYRILISPTDNQPIKVQIPGLKKISWVIESIFLDIIRIEINN